MISKIIAGAAIVYCMAAFLAWDWSWMVNVAEMAAVHRFITGFLYCFFTVIATVLLDLAEGNNA